MKSTSKTLEQLEQTADIAGWQPPQVDGGHTVYPIDQSNDSVAATHHTELTQSQHDTVGADLCVCPFGTAQVSGRPAGRPYVGDTAQSRADTQVRPYKANTAQNTGRPYDDGHRVNATNHAWLVRIGLISLVNEMMRLSRAYDFPWKARWEHHLDNPHWLGKAMTQTFTQLTPEDKDTVRALYDDWLWFEKHVDMQALVMPEYNALCYVLDGKGKRVCNAKGPVAVLRGLKGQDKQQALKTLDRQRYEFEAWW